MNDKNEKFIKQLYSSFFKNDKSNSKLVIAIILVFNIIAFLGIAISSLHGGEEDSSIFSFTTKEKIMELEEFGYSKEEIELMKEEDIDDLFDNVYSKTYNQFAGDRWSKELDSNEASSLKTKYYQYAMSGEYEQIINNFESLKTKYYFSLAHNKKIIRLYNDAYSINSAFNDKKNLVQQRNMISNLNDERMLLFALLQSDVNIRNTTLRARTSLSFSVSEDDNLRINSIYSSSVSHIARMGMHEKDAYLNNLFEYLSDGEYIIYKINFAVNSDVFNAYLYKDVNDPKMCIYGIFAQNPSELNGIFKTVIELDEITSMIENELKSNNTVSDIPNNSDNSLSEDENTDDNNLSEDENTDDSSEENELQNPSTENISDTTYEEENNDNEDYFFDFENIG